MKNALFMNVKNMKNHVFVDFDENGENAAFVTSNLGFWRKRSKTLFFDPIRKTTFLDFRCFYL